MNFLKKSDNLDYPKIINKDRGQPLAVLVEFDCYTGLPFITDYPKLVPITPVTSIFKIKNKHELQYSRTQIPLKLAWSMTVHKAQGQTLDKIFVNLDKQDKFPGQIFVALSRVKNIENLAILNFSQNRIMDNYKDKKYQEMQKEYNRLIKLSDKTCVNQIG